MKHYLMVSISGFRGIRKQSPLVCKKAETFLLECVDAIFCVLTLNSVLIFNH